MDRFLSREPRLNSGAVKDGDGYGYQWFVTTYPLGDGSIEAFVRSGWGGQVLAVFPTLDMEVVITGGDYVLATNAEDLITDYILRAVDPQSG
jgi:CubicO group peptidase (beta-lactamase class C family)